MYLNKGNFMLVSLLLLVFVLGSNNSYLPLHATTQQTLGTLTVIKTVDNPANILNLNFEPSDFSFRITFNNGSSPVFDVPESGVSQFSIRGGEPYDVREIVLERNNNIDFRVIRGSNCSGTLSGGQDVTCIIRNEIIGFRDGDSEAGIIDPFENRSEAGVIEGNAGPVPTPEGVGQAAGATESEAGLITEPIAGGAPFKRCLSPTAEAVESGDPNPKETQIVPSSATYTISGKTSVSELLSSVDSDNFLTIQIFNDQKLNDGVTFGTASPRLIGTIDVGRSQVTPIDTFDFPINDIDTSCDFITLVAPFSQKPDEKFFPLANTSDVDPSDFDLELGATLPEQHIKNRLLAYCTLDAKTGQVSSACGDITGSGTFNTVVINPPFRTCQTAFGDPVGTETRSNFDVYVLKGSIGSITHETMNNLISDGNSRSFTIQIVIDNVLRNQDQVKIVDSNNPFMTVYFIIDAGESEAEILPFKISRVSTQCTDVGFNANPQIN